MWTRIVQLWQSLDKWKKKWDSDHQNEVCEVSSNTQLATAQVMPWKTVLTFSRIEVANAFVMYHAAAILLTGVPLSILRAGHIVPASVVKLFHPISFDEVQLTADIKTSAVFICRSIEHHIRLLQLSQNQRDFHLLFPMHIARLTFRCMNLSFQLAWLAEAFDMVQPSTSMGIWAYLESSCSAEDSQYINQWRSVC